MNSTYEPAPRMIDPFVLHFLSSTIEPPPPLPLAIFFYDPFLVVPSPPACFSEAPPSPPSPPLCPTKAPVPIRHRYSPVQQFVLHRIFQQLPYPSLDQRRIIADNLQIDVDQVRIWFSNRRSRKRVSQPQTNLLQPTSKEYSSAKDLFDQLKLAL